MRFVDVRRNQGMVDEIFTSLIPPECVRYQGAGRWGKEGGIRKGEGVYVGVAWNDVGGKRIIPTTCQIFLLAPHNQDTTHCLSSVSLPSSSSHITT